MFQAVESVVSEWSDGVSGSQVGSVRSETLLQVLYYSGLTVKLATHDVTISPSFLLDFLGLNESGKSFHGPSMTCYKRSSSAVLPWSSCCHGDRLQTNAGVM